MGRSLVALLLVVVACHGKSPARATSETGATDADAPGSVDGDSVSDPVVDDLWARAAAGEADDLARLADREGSDRLIESALDGARRITSLRALAFAPDLTPLPFLVSVASTGGEEEAREALLGVNALLLRPRRAVDPDDALEIGEGSRGLVLLAKNLAAPRERRVLAVRALRLLADRGAVSPKDIPQDLDPH